MVAKIKVNPPTLPKNIRQIKIIWETSPRSGVIPNDNPTVPIADAVSNKAVISGISSVLLITIPPTRNKTIYIKKIVAAFLIVSSGICLPKKLVCSFFQNTDNADETRTARVVVFIPPAVEPGEPPMSISIMISICPTSLSKVKSAVLNPAVLGVTD